MLGFKPEPNLAPSDPADRGRCIRLLNLIPEWWDRLDEMEQYEAQRSLVIGPGGMTTDTNSWMNQIPLIREQATQTIADKFTAGGI